MTDAERIAQTTGRRVESQSALSDVEFFLRYALGDLDFSGVKLDVETMKVIRDHFESKHNNNHG